MTQREKLITVLASRIAVLTSFNEYDVQDFINGDDDVIAFMSDAVDLSEILKKAINDSDNEAKAAMHEVLLLDTQVRDDVMELIDNI